ncbi:hypothetical protein F5884DRAFT_887845, partial [Xylogone sp. PMI_703]
EKGAPWINFRAAGNETLFSAYSVVPNWITQCRVRKPRTIESLGEWLFHGMACHASRAEDKVFAFFGLFPGAHLHGVVADYNISIGKIYTGIAAFLISNGGFLKEVLQKSSGREIILNEKKLNIPSWVPDFRRPASAPRFPDLQPGMRQVYFSAGKFRNPGVLSQTGSLVIWGSKLLDEHRKHTGSNVEGQKILNMGSYTKGHDNLKIVFETQFSEVTDEVVLTQTSPSSTLILHLRKTSISHCYKLIGECIMVSSATKSEAMIESIAFPISKDFIVGGLASLEYGQFEDFWIVYQIFQHYKYLWNNKIFHIDISTGSNQSGDDPNAHAWVPDMLTQKIYGDYRRLCSIPSKNDPGRENTHSAISSFEFSDVVLRQLKRFQSFWKKDAYSQKWGHKFYDLERIVELIQRDNLLVPLNFPDLLNAWLQCIEDVRARMSIFIESLPKYYSLEALEALEVSDTECNEISNSYREDTLQKVSSWREATISLITSLHLDENSSCIWKYPRVSFSSGLYKDRRASEFPRQYGLLIHLHCSHCESWSSEEENSVMGLSTMRDVHQIFEAICKTLEDANQNFVKLWNMSAYNIDDGVKCLLRDWTQLREILCLIEFSRRLTKEQRAAFLRVKVLRNDIRFQDDSKPLTVEKEKWERIFII